MPVKEKYDLWCKRCRRKLRNGAMWYCLDCWYELKRLERKKEWDGERISKAKT